MKKYHVIMLYNGEEGGFIITARDEKSARNKAVRRAQYVTGDKTITGESITSVEYLGFYMGRVFVPVETLAQVLR